MAETKPMTRVPQRKGTEIDLLRLAHELWRNVLLIIVCGILGGIVSLAYTFFLVTPTYSASTTLFVNTKNFSLGSTSITYSDLSTADRMVDIYITILSSRETLQEIAEEAGVPYNYSAMRNKISASYSDSSGSGIFKVTVRSASPTEAELLANTVATVLPRRISDIVEGTSVKVVEYAVVPTHRSGPNYLNSTVKGGLAGAVLICMVIVLLELLRMGSDTNIHNSDELRNLYPDIPILATVPDMRGKKKTDYYTSYYAQKKPADKGAKK